MAAQNNIIALFRGALGGSAIGALIASAAMAQTTPPGPTISGMLPASLPPHSTPTPEAARPFFDTFSWQSFVALMWPVDSSRRGAPRDPTDPATLTAAGNAYPTVWGSYLTDTDLFPGGSKRPIDWQSVSTSVACPQAATGAKVLTMISKSGSLLTDMSQSFSYPLVDQNNNYVYYQIAFNKEQYEFIRGVDGDPTTWLYRAQSLMLAEQKAPIAMPISSPAAGKPGAIMVKAAWKQLAVSDDLSRYYWIDGYVYNTTSTPAACREEKLGLIGFHIARKVAPFPQWVWSTFEQIDNVPPDVGPPPFTPMTLNNGSDDPATVQGWANRPDFKTPLSPDKRIKTQVTRFNPIPTTPAGNATTDLNTRWRQALAGTPLAFYQLAVTQWPSMPVPQDQFQTLESGGLYPNSAGQPFPLSGAVNTSMETYFQSQRDAAGAGGNSCMQCHYTAGKADFSWSLNLRAY